MIKIEPHGYYTGGKPKRWIGEERICLRHLCIEEKRIHLLKPLVKVCLEAGMIDAYVVMTFPSYEVRHSFYIFQEGLDIDNLIQAWWKTLRNMRGENFSLYLACQPVFDQNKLLLAIMKAPEGIFRSS